MFGNLILNICYCILGFSGTGRQNLFIYFYLDQEIKYLDN